MVLFKLKSFKIFYLVNPFSFHDFMFSADASLPGVIDFWTDEALLPRVPSILLEEHGCMPMVPIAACPEDNVSPVLSRAHTSWSASDICMEPPNGIKSGDKDVSLALLWSSEDWTFSCNSEEALAEEAFPMFPEGQRSEKGAWRILCGYNTDEAAAYRKSSASNKYTP